MTDQAAHAVISPDALTLRQVHEVEFHAEYAAGHRYLAETPVSLDVCTAHDRRWWNAYWAFYDLIRATRLVGLRVLVPGCGFGEDCIRLASLGAQVYGIDISPEIIEICRARAAIFAPGHVTLGVMPSEKLEFPDGYFDAVVLVNILHHVDIAATMAEVRRVSKPGAKILGLEMYTHSSVQRIRQSAVLTRVVYPFVVRRIYRGKPYITPDERKINEKEFSSIVSGLQRQTVEYFSILVERVFSSELVGLAKLDRLLTRALGPVGGLLAGRVVFSGTLNK
jgi:ubiquinone/menaquinone biosynthesis C-methylase UbiE